MGCSELYFVLLNGAMTNKITLNLEVGYRQKDRARDKTTGKTRLGMEQKGMEQCTRKESDRGTWKKKNNTENQKDSPKVNPCKKKSSGGQPDTRPRQSWSLEMDYCGTDWLTTRRTM